MTRQDGLFEVYGFGKLGGKAEDLNDHSELVAKHNMNNIGGFVLASAVLADLLDWLDYNDAVTPDVIMALEYPDFLQEINTDILSKIMVGRPYAVRSSALSERGGIGIYRSSFFVPTGDQEKDLAILWQKEKEVFASEFSDEAIAWRRKVKGHSGMSILIVPMSGVQLGKYFLPPISGTAHTSYRGLPTVRVVTGLGTKAVAGHGVVYHEAPHHPTNFLRDLWDQELADAINLETGEIEAIDPRWEELYGQIDFHLFQELFARLYDLSQSGDFYLEWVITPNGIDVVQIAPYNDKHPDDVNYNIDLEKFFLLVEGSDTFNQGRSDCRGIVLVSEWNEETSAYLRMLNSKLSDYLLIIDQYAFSYLSKIHGVPFTFAHFSNSKAVVESQTKYSSENRLAMAILGFHLADHTQFAGQGAYHFQQLCDRSDILFIGSQFNSYPLFCLPSKIVYGQGEGEVVFWDAEAVAVVDEENIGRVYIGKHLNVSEKKINRVYYPELLRDWSFVLRDAANRLSDAEDPLAEEFYLIHYAIAPDMSPIDFDPFSLDPDIIEEDGEDKIIESLKIVIAHGDTIIGTDNWNSGLSDYLQELLNHLQGN